MKVQLSISKDITTFKQTEVEFKNLHKVTETLNYSPIIYIGDKRAQKNFQSVNLIILDFDGELSLEAAKMQFQEYICLIVTTKSHQTSIKNGKSINKEDRFRVILVGNKKISDLQEYKKVIKNVISQFNSDTACSDGARFFYPNSKQIVWYSKGVEFLDVDKYINKNTSSTSISSIKQKSQCNKFNLIMDCNDNPKVTAENGEVLIASQWAHTIEDEETILVYCPNKEHNDNNPSAFISKSWYGYDQIHIHCHKCGSLGDFPKKIKIIKGKNYERKIKRIYY